MMNRASALLLITTMAVAAAGTPRAEPAQEKKKEEICPWCKNDPKILEACGCVSHGPFHIGKKDTIDLAKRLPAPRWIFLESKHLRYATSLGPLNIPLGERARVEAELERLRKVFPNIPKKIQQLDPWLRIHLTVMKSEDLYEKFERLLNVTDADFPESRGTGAFMGDGKYLGEKEKFEVVLHTDRTTHFLFTEENMGARTTDALRWHFKEPHHLTASIAAVDDLVNDKFLFPHIAHNLAHLFFCAYKHYSYDPPYWLDEGIAHLMEIESFKDLNITYCSDEGAGPDRERSKDWMAVVKTLIEKRRATPFAELIHKKNFADLSREDHVTAWAKVKFLSEAHAAKFAQFLGSLKGRLDDKGYPTGKDMPGYQRELIKELWNWTADSFDQEWEAWIKKQK
ncbi:MAG: hypothetical protein HY286_01980 [Planctomycetes bacterium]|nr:hypothetical protein [Planctomycetota bacterium]